MNAEREIPPPRRLAGNRSPDWGRPENPPRAAVGACGVPGLASPHCPGRSLLLRSTRIPRVSDRSAAKTPEPSVFCNVPFQRPPSPEPRRITRARTESVSRLRRHRPRTQSGGAGHTPTHTHRRDTNPERIDGPRPAPDLTGFTDADEMLDSGLLDLVVVSTPRIVTMIGTKALSVTCTLSWKSPWH